MKARLLIVILTLAFAHTANAQWQQTAGPYGGTVSSLARTTDGFIAVVGQDLYLYKNNTWRLIVENWRGQLIQNGNIILSAHVESAKVSTDNGGTWQDTKLPSDHVEVQFDQFLSVSNDSIFVSTDGISWAFRSLTPPEPQGFTAHHGRLYCFSGFNGLMYSDDGGVTWEMLQNQPPFHATIKWVSTGAALYAMPYPSGIYQTTDNGQTWEAINYNLYEGMTFDGIAQSGDDVFLSDWLTTYRLQEERWVEIPVGRIKTSLITNGTLYIATEAGLVSYKDNTFTDHSSGAIAGNVTRFGSAGYSLFAKTNVGVFRTRNGGQSWELNLNGYAEDIASAKGSVMVRGTSILRSTDEGNTWVNIDPAFEEFVVAPTRLIDYNDDLYLTSGLVSSGEHGSGAGWTTGGVYRSSDGGESWYDISTNLPHNGVTHVPVFNILGAKDNLLLQTADGLFIKNGKSQSWGRVTPNVTGPFAQIFTTGEKFMMLLDSSWYSSENADFWEPIVATAPADFMRNYENVYHFSTIRGTPYITTARYEKIDSITSRTIFRNFKLVGSSWIDITDELPKHTITTAMHEHQSELFAATSSLGVWKNGLPQAGIEYTPATEMLAVYPNPASVYVEVTGSVLSITNTLGQDVTSMTYGYNRTTMSHENPHVDISQLPPGSYHVRTDKGLGSFIKN